MNSRIPIPRDPDDDYTAAMAARRRDFATARSGTSLAHTGSFSIEPAQLAGNIENFIGAAQVPIGLAGPLRVNGEHARGGTHGLGGLRAHGAPSRVAPSRMRRQRSG